MITEEKYLEAKKLVADYESEQLNKHIVSRSKTEEAVAYGDYVMMTDRFETVHIWSKELEGRNAGRWKPSQITKEEYDKEMQHSWNKK